MTGLTAKEMEYEAKVAYEAIASADAPGYTSRQWSILLTQAQEKVVRSIARDGMDKNEFNRRAISKLITTQTEAAPFPVIAHIPNSNDIEFDSDYLYILQDTANTGVRVKPISYDYYHMNTDNPFEKPYDKEFWRLTSKKGVTVITDGTPLVNYVVTYIKRPKPIITKELTTATAIEEYTAITDCELDHSVHREIVSVAARLANAYTTNQVGYQIQDIENQK
jgi:hypothetical protein